MKPVFAGLFGSAEEVFSNFQTPAEEQKGVRILFAWYEYEDYSGNAYVLFQKGHKLYQVGGGHCSCDGLEGQWKPAAVTLKDLAKLATTESAYDRYTSLLKPVVAKLARKRKKAKAKAVAKAKK